jgi:GH18 family chitinase
LFSTGGLSTFKTLKNNYPNVKLLISIGGANYNSNSAFSPIAASASSRATFAANVLSLIQSNNLNGGI